MSVQNSDTTNKSLSVIYTALSSFTPSWATKKMVVSADLPPLDPTRITAITVTAPSSGTNGIYTSASEGTVVVGTTYAFVVQNTMAYAPNMFYTFSATAQTTSFSDLADQFVAQGALYIAGKNTVPMPATMVNTGGHIVITEVPPTGYTAGESHLDVGFIYAQNSSTAFNAWTTTATVKPVGQYATLQRAYLTSTGQSLPGSISGVFPGTGWIGNGPVSGKTYTAIQISYSPVDKPNNSETPYFTYTAYASSDFSAAELLYIKGVFGDFSSQTGVGVGDLATITPTATSASGTAIIPSGLRAASVLGNASNFVSLPATQPIGKPIILVGNGTAYKVSATAALTINSGTASGSSLFPASCTITCTPQITTAGVTNWLCTALLNSGASTVTAVPASS